MRVSFLFLCVWTGVVCCGCNSAGSTADLPPVMEFDAEKYMGQWYEIARFPHPFEKDLARVTAFYTLERDGTIRVENRGYLPGGRLRTVKAVAYQPEPGTGLLRISFFRPFYGEYRIILLERDYSAAIVTGSTRDFLWILSRSTELSAAKKTAYLNFITRCGFDAGKLLWLDWQKSP